MPMSSEETQTSPIFSDTSTCRDFLRNACRRGTKCKFRHPSSEECERLRRSERIFCHDYQNSTCRRINCKFLHLSREAESIFRLTGHLPTDNELSSETTTSSVEKPPICKDFLNGICSRGAGCKYRHVERHPTASFNHVRPTESLEDQLMKGEYEGRVAVPHQNPLLSHASPDAVLLSQNPMPPPLLSVSTPIQPCERLHHLPQSSLPNTGVIQQQQQQQQQQQGRETILAPVNDIYASVTNPTPVVGVLSHSSYPTSNVQQHTLYAHPRDLHAYPSLVAVSSANQTASCSSVLAVVAEPSQHPSVLQHPVHAAATPQRTTYLFPTSTNPIQHLHLSSASSPSVSAATLVTFPISQFTSAASTILHPQAASVACTPQHASGAAVGYLPVMSVSAGMMSNTLDRPQQKIEPICAQSSAPIPVSVFPQQQSFSNEKLGNSNQVARMGGKLFFPLPNHVPVGFLNGGHIYSAIHGVMISHSCGFASGSKPFIT